MPLPLTSPCASSSQVHNKSMTDETSQIAQPKDRPWIFRTYAGHSNAGESNALYRKNLEKGQTGLSVAFDLPTQTGYDADDVLARGEVGKVGVPIAHLGDMRALFDELPLSEMNTSMTINATAPWLLALYIAVADEQGADRATLRGTTQNDLIKEYLSRGTYIYPPGPSLRLTVDMITFCQSEMPKFNPVNVCSYHLQEAGATPMQELAFALATAVCVLDEVRTRDEITPEILPHLVGRISFFVNAGVKFVTEMCKMRAFTELWDEITETRYGVEDPKMRRFRYGMQVNSLGLTEPQPENNVYRILLEMLAVTLSKDARARAVQLPAWNEALGLPRPWDQQWSLRAQQILALETDLLEFDDLFTGSPVVEAKVGELKDLARAELTKIEKMGGVVAAVENGYMKEALVASNTARLAAIQSGDQKVVGVNVYEETEPSPLSTGDDAIMMVDEDVEKHQIEQLNAWRRSRNTEDVRQALDELTRVAKDGGNIMPASIAAAKAGVTTGEWGRALRDVFGEFRAPTGTTARPAMPAAALDQVRKEVARVSKQIGEPIKLLVAKPGLDGHSNGAEQIAVWATEGGFEVTYGGIRQTPEAIVTAAKEGKVHCVGLSVLSGSHVKLAEEIMHGLRDAGLTHVPVVLGGIIPESDAGRLKQSGIRAIYTPRDYKLADILLDIVGLVERAAE